MKTSILKTFGVVSTLAIILAASAGRADVLSTNTSTTEISSPAYPLTWLTFDINQFNPALGTLNSVQLTVSGQVVANLIFSNYDGATGSVRIDQFTTFQIAYFNSSSTNLLVDDENFEWSTPGFPTRIQVGAGGAYTHSWGPENEGPVTQNYTLPSDLANFTGMGVIPVAAQLSATTEEDTSGGNYFVSMNTSGSATAEVIYDFTPVPEPTTIALVAIGLLGALMIRRRKV